MFVCAGQKSIWSVTPQEPSMCFLKQNLSLGPETDLVGLGWQASNSQGFVCLPHVLPHMTFCMGLNAGPHVYMANTFLTNLCFQAYNLLNVYFSYFSKARYFICLICISTSILWMKKFRQMFFNNLSIV